MKLKNVKLQRIVELAKQLSPLEKIQLIEQVLPDLEEPLKTNSEESTLLSAYGSLVDLGDAPSEKEIDEVRQEVFGGFPREDI